MGRLGERFSGFHGNFSRKIPFFTPDFTNFNAEKIKSVGFRLAALSNWTEKWPDLRAPTPHFVGETAGPAERPIAPLTVLNYLRKGPKEFREKSRAAAAAEGE